MNTVRHASEVGGPVGGGISIQGSVEISQGAHHHHHKGSHDTTRPRLREGEESGPLHSWVMFRR